MIEDREENTHPEAGLYFALAFVISIYALLCVGIFTVYGVWTFGFHRAALPAGIIVMISGARGIAKVFFGGK